MGYKVNRERKIVGIILLKPDHALSMSIFFNIDISIVRIYHYIASSANILMLHFDRHMPYIMMQCKSHET